MTRSRQRPGLLAATGHCPQLSAPDETIRAITDFLREHDRAAPGREGSEAMTQQREAREAFLDALVYDDPVLLYERAPCGFLSTTPD